MIKQWAPGAAQGTGARAEGHAQYTHTHARTHARTHACTHTHTHTHKHTRTNTCRRTARSPAGPQTSQVFARRAGMCRARVLLLLLLPLACGLAPFQPSDDAAGRWEGWGAGAGGSSVQVSSVACVRACVRAHVCVFRVCAWARSCTHVCTRVRMSFARRGAEVRGGALELACVPRHGHAPLLGRPCQSYSRA